MKALIVEDDLDMSDLIASYLSSHADEVVQAHNVADFMRAYQQEQPDYCVIDWLLPDGTGQDCLKWVRQNHGWDVPMLVLTSRSDEEDIVSGLRAGADDYLTKPVRSQELLARVEVLTRRIAAANVGFFKAGAFEIDLNGLQMKVNGQAQSMTQKEIDLAYYFFSNPGKLFSRMHLLDKVWGVLPDVDTRTVDTHVSRLRKKLDLSGALGYKLQPVYGQGYRMEKVSVAEPVA